MSDPRKQALAPYLRCLADRLGLKDWSVRIDDDAPEDGRNAQCDIPFGRKVLGVRLCEAFLADAPEDQRQTLVHELIHAHLYPADGIARRGLGDGAWHGYVQAREYAVDALADVLAPTLPLPGDVKAKDPEVRWPSVG